MLQIIFNQNTIIPNTTKPISRLIGTPQIHRITIKYFIPQTLTFILFLKNIARTMRQLQITHKRTLIVNPLATIKLKQTIKRLRFKRIMHRPQALCEFLQTIQIPTINNRIIHPPMTTNPIARRDTLNICIHKIIIIDKLGLLPRNLF